MYCYTRIAFVLMAAAIGCSRPAPGPDQKQQAVESAATTVPLFDDLGTHHRAVSTKNEQAQKYFDQGLRLTYGFNHDEAERAFREAAQLDPNLAMAWWGVANALGPNINLPLDEERNKRALDAVAKAKSLIGSAGESERAYIEAVAVRYSADPAAKRADLDRAYAKAMGDVFKRFPNDADAGALYAEALMDLKPWQLWTLDGKPREETLAIVQVLETVMKLDPDHPGANHYYIHAVEASPNPEKAAASAERLHTLVPGAGHLVHMPAHVYIRTGNYAGAVDANAHAVKVDEAYIARTKAEGVYPLMYYTHNFMFLSTAASMLGRTRQALDTAAKAASIAAPMAGHDAMAEYVLPWTLYAMARNARWDDILASSRPADSTPSTLAMWHYARTLAFIGKGDAAAAKKSQAEFVAARAKVPKDAMLNTNRAEDLLGIAGSVLDARMARAAGAHAGALAHWQKAIAIQDQLVYDEPPAWYYPVRESLGAEQLLLKRYGEAEKTFRRDLEINPNNPRSLFGLSEVAKAQSRSDAAEARRRFETAWQGAELELSVAGM
jgi:tetratricopeptide (TPR) repeat protein